MEKRKAKTAPFLILALVFLFNPNIHIIDFLPDFVAYFIIARLLERPASCAPYFEEARSASIKLFWVSLAKIPAFLLAVFIRSNNTLDNDIYPMLSLIFATIEIILTVILIKNISSAFFYLGERGSASALISPFPLSKNGKRDMRPEELKAYSIMFAVAKCLLYTIPEFLLLSRTAENGTITPSPLSRFYPITLLVSLALGFVIGGIWLSRSKKYARAIALEGEFNNSLSFLARAESEKKYETKLKLRSISKALFILTLSCFFTFRLAFQETEQINIFPGFIFAFFLLLSIYRLNKHTKERVTPMLTVGGIYVAVSIVSFIFSARFLNKYDYIDLITSKAAKAEYIPVVILAGLEFFVFSLLMVFAAKQFFGFIYENTGVSPYDERYGRTESEYHSELKKRTVIMTVLAILLSFSKCLDTILYLGAKRSISDVNGVPSTITSSAIPWFGVVITVLSVLFIAYTLYYANLLKEEATLKYSKE